MTVGVRVQLRRDTAANWATHNPVLLQGEPGMETDTLKFKLGDGSTAWSSLGYQGASSGGGASLTPTAIQSSGTYVASAGDFVLVDLSTANVTISLPSAPADKGQVGYKILKYTSGNTLTILTQGSDVMELAAGATSAKPPIILNATKIYQYQHSTAIWLALMGDSPVSQLDARYGTGLGLSIGRGGCVIPVGTRAHLIADNASNGTDTDRTWEHFEPLSDPSVLDVLPIFTNPLGMVGWAGGDIDAPNAITVSASVKMSDGTLVPFLFNGSRTIQIGANYGQMAIPDAPVHIGTQVTANDNFANPIVETGFFLRVRVTVAGSRQDGSGGTGTVTVTSGSPTVADTNIQSSDQGRVVTGVGIPGTIGNSGQTYVGTVTPNTSFLLSSSPTTQVNVNASANGTACLINSVIPFNYSSYSNADKIGVNGGGDLTAPGSSSPTGGSGSFSYGPTIILGRSKLRKPIIGVMSDSILDGYSEDFHSPYFGPVARACLNLGLPLVKGSKGGETAGSISLPNLRKYRAPFFSGVTHCIVSYGTNDGVLNGAGGVTTLTTRLVTIGTWLSSQGIRPYLCTIPPRTTTTDGWASLAGQTPITGSQITFLASMNQAIRAGLSPYVGFYDLCGVVNSSTDSGLFAISANGRHITDANMTISTNILTSATANFTNADIGTGVFVTGAITGTGAVIAAVTNSTTVTITNGVGGAALNASATVTNVVAGIGAYGFTNDGVHPLSSLMTGAVTTGVQTLFTPFVV